MRIKDEVAINMFGMTTKEALSSERCINCRAAVKVETLSEEQHREYNMSGLCPSCRETLIASGQAGRLD